MYQNHIASEWSVATPSSSYHHLITAFKKPCVFNVCAQLGKDKTLQVKVMKIHQLENPEGETAEKKLEAACDSPSSDKENASQENQKKEPPPPSPRGEENRRESLSEFCQSPQVIRRCSES